MSSFGDKIGKAQAAQAARPAYKDVTVSLDSHLVDEREKLLADLAALDKQRDTILAAVADTLALKPDTSSIDRKMNAITRKLEKLDEAEQDTLVTIRIYRAPGDEWMDLKAACPARANSAIDRGVGYNINTLTKAACVKYGRVVDGDTETVQTLEEWESFFPLLAGSEFERICDVTYGVNVGESQRRTEALKKASAVAAAYAKK